MCSAQCDLHHRHRIHRDAGGCDGEAGLRVEADPFEVADIFEVPLDFLMNPAHHRWHAVALEGAQREFLSMPWDGLDASGQAKRYFVWGATAAMLRNLYRLLVAEA